MATRAPVRACCWSRASEPRGRTTWHPHSEHLAHRAAPRATEPSRESRARCPRSGSRAHPRPGGARQRRPDCRLDTSAVISVTPAARASAISSQRERRADAAVLVLVRYRDRDLGTVPVPHETCDRDGPRVPVDVGDECVVVCVHAVSIAAPARRGVACCRGSAGASTARRAGRRARRPCRVSSPERPDEQPGAVPELNRLECTARGYEAASFADALHRP